jgi:hypothetical protein
VIVIGETQMRLLLACAHRRNCQVCAAALRRVLGGRVVRSPQRRAGDPGE